jgi:hypothetical protein
MADSQFFRVRCNPESALEIAGAAVLALTAARNKLSTTTYMENFMSKQTGMVVAILAIVGLIASLTAPAHATFPGKNGRIAFRMGNPDAYTMNPDGTDIQQLTNLGPDNFAAWEYWSADGKQIIFTEFPPPDFNAELLRAATS